MYQQPKVEKKKEDKIKYSNFPLTRINFVLMAICGAMILIGFLLMLGSSNQPTSSAHAALLWVLPSHSWDLLEWHLQLSSRKNRYLPVGIVCMVQCRDCRKG